MRPLASISLMVVILSLVVMLPSRPIVAQPNDDLGKKIQAVFDQGKKFLVTVSFQRMIDTGQFGQQDAGGSLTGVLIDGNGTVMVSGQDFYGAANVGGLARMLGQQGGGEPSNFRIRLGSGTEFAAEFLGGDKEANVAFAKAKLEEGMTLPAVTFDTAAAEKLEIGQQVVMLGTLPDFLNHARKFHLARINAIIDAKGGLFGLDGPVEQCLGGLVLTLEGKAVGVVSEKANPQANPAAGGIGRLLRGVTQGGQGLRTLVLSTPPAFSKAWSDAKNRPTQPATSNPNPNATPTPDPNAAAVAEMGLTRYVALTDESLTAMRNMGLKLDGVTGGVMVLGVAENSRLAAAGLKRRNMILAVGDVDLAKVTAESELPRFTAALVAAAKTGDVKLKVWSEGEITTLTLRK